MNKSPKTFSALVTAVLMAVLLFAPAHAEARSRKQHQHAAPTTSYSTQAGYFATPGNIFSWTPSTGNPLSYNPYATTPAYTYGYAPLTYPMSYSTPATTAYPAIDPYTGYPINQPAPVSYPQNYPAQYPTQNQNYPANTTPYIPPQNPVTPSTPNGGSQSGGYSF